jgi:hypothetical protein
MSWTPRATDGEVFELSELLLKELPACYLTVDGLDECPDRGEFFRLLSRIPE